MRIRTTLAIAASVLALGPALNAAAVPPVPLVDTLPDTVGYCNLADLTGSVDYDPPIQFGTTAQPVTWVMTLHFACTGTGTYNGTYDMTFAGSGSERCTDGVGSGGLVSGAKTSGPGTGPIVSGQIVFRRAGLHYYVSRPANGVGFTVHETASGLDRPYQANLWLDLPSYLRPYVATDVAVSPVLTPEGGAALPSASARASFTPGPCIDAHDLVGHGFLGRKSAVLDQVDAVLAPILGGLG